MLHKTKDIAVCSQLEAQLPKVSTVNYSCEEYGPGVKNSASRETFPLIFFWFCFSFDLSIPTVLYTYASLVGSADWKQAKYFPEWLF